MISDVYRQLSKLIQSSIVIDHLNTQFEDQNVAVSYLYFNFKYEQEQSGSMMAAVLLKHLIMQIQGDLPKETEQLSGLTTVFDSRHSSGA